MTRFDWEKARARDLGMAAFRERGERLERCPACGATLRGISKLHGRDIYEPYLGTLRPTVVLICPNGDGASEEVWFVEVGGRKLAVTRSC